MSPRAAPVGVVVRGAVAEIALSNGDGNRLDAAGMIGLQEAAATVTDDARVRVVLVSGTGRSFCAGAATALDVAAPDGLAAIAALPMPTIALLQGRVTGLGLALALTCDLRCAARDVRLELRDPVRGVLAGGGALARLPRLVGPARAAEMALLDRPVTAATALSWGLVTLTVPRAGLRAAARRLARALVDRGPLGVRFAKEAVVRALDLPLDDGIRLEQDLYVMLQTTADRQEGVAAFLARRPPRFHGR